jgi:hypothetical protein
MVTRPHAPRQVEAGRLDPLACKIAGHEAWLANGNCSSAGFGDYKGNDPVFKKVGLWFKTAPLLAPPSPPPLLAPGNFMHFQPFRDWNS